jgi:hypothetical protein
MMLAFNNSILLCNRVTIGLMDDSFVEIKGWNNEFCAVSLRITLIVVENCFSTRLMKDCRKRTDLRFLMHQIYPCITGVVINNDKKIMCPINGSCGVTT